MSYTRSVKVVGLYLLRNEADIIETNLRHHFAVGIDEAIVIDNGSADGTLELLANLTEDMPIQLSSEVGPMYQQERVTRMARLATLQGADWLLPIDADEFWVGTGAPLRHVLEETPSEARLLVVELVNFVQSRDVLAAEPGCLASMSMTPERTFGPGGDLPRMVREEEIGFVEIRYTPKCVHRATPDATVSKGNHYAGERGATPTDRITCLHAPLRALSTLTTKLDHGRRAFEDGVPGEASWHVKRWWQMARDGTLDREWEALSYQDGAITVGGRRRELVRDDRLRHTVTDVAPLVRTTAADVHNPTAAMPPAVGAYLLALETVPGWLSMLDFRLLVELDRLQRHYGIGGDLFEIGTYLGKSAILLGHLARLAGDRLTVCDVFEHIELIDQESFPGFNHWYSTLTERAFVEQYQRFHAELPEIIVGASETIDVKQLDRARTCRLVHVDGGHRYDIVRADASTAQQLLSPGGIVAFGGISASHFPGTALAVWELVLGREFTPLCLTGGKLYGTWDAGGVDWSARIDEWVSQERDLGSEIHTLAGWPVRRVFAHERPPVPAEKLVRIPDLEDLPGGASAGEKRPNPSPSPSPSL